MVTKNDVMFEFHSSLRNTPSKSRTTEVTATINGMVSGEQIVLSGKTTCYFKDQDVKIIGQKKAIENLIKVNKLSKNIRTAIWESFKDYSVKSRKLMV